MELHCHWPVQTTKMEERNGGFHGSTVQRVRHAAGGASDVQRHLRRCFGRAIHLRENEVAGRLRDRHVLSVGLGVIEVTQNQ